MGVGFDTVVDGAVHLTGESSHETVDSENDYSVYPLNSSLGIPTGSWVTMAPMTRSHLSRILLALVILGASPAPGSTPTRQGTVTTQAADPVAQRVANRAVNTQVAAAKRTVRQLGVHIVELGSGEPLYAYNAEAQRIIASNTKLFTSAAALDRLGPGFFFETQLLTRGAIRGVSLDGDLGVRGGGDPSLSGRQYDGDSFGAFRTWARVLKDAGITRVGGDLVLFDGFFDRQWVHPDWPKDQLTRWYEAPVSALSFNDNCVLLKVAPDHSTPAPTDTRVEVLPDTGLFQVVDSTRTTGRSRDQWMALGRKETPGDETTLTARGAIYKRTESVDKWVTVPDPTAYFAAGLRRALAEEGVEIAGGVRFEDHPADPTWRPLHTHRSDLLTALEVINKRSQNFYAEAVFKLLGAHQCGVGTWDGGRRAVTEFLDEVGIPEGSYNLADGSGMSRNNRFTPQQVTTLLEHMFYHPQGKEFLATLPYSGEGGLRWERRMAHGNYRGNVMAKTGYLSGVTALSGYAKARSGKVYAFAILSNGIRGKGAANTAEDRIVKALIDHG